MVWIILSAVFQIVCIVHCLRNRRNNLWIMGVLFFSLIGCAAYFIVEILPELQGNRRVRRAGEQIADRVDPDRRVRAARTALDLSDTVATRLALGDALALQMKHGEALEEYLAARRKSAMADPAIAMRLADAYLELGQPAKALDAIDSLPEGGTQVERDKRLVLRARLIEQQGDIRGALAIYEEAMDRVSGDDVRARAAAARLALGDLAGARALLEEIEKRMRHLPKGVMADHAAMYGWVTATLVELRG
jgi:hypothetical protein